jgi:predicted PurR-regulated permease PerM
MLVGAILCVLYSAGFWIVGTPYPFLIGIVSGLGNFIPFVGTLFGVVLATALVLLDGSGWTTLLLTFAVFGVVQGLESWVITPRIVGRRVGLSPLAVLVAVLVFGELFGLVGVVLAVPVAAALRITGSLVLQSYRRSVVYRGRLTPARVGLATDRRYGRNARASSARRTSSRGSRVGSSRRSSKSAR